MVQSAPLIQPNQATFTSFDGQGQISAANFTQAYAKNLALAMQFGSLPVRLDPLTTETVSPTLGQLGARRPGSGPGWPACPRPALHDRLLPAARRSSCSRAWR